jgi:hypothetical protein
MITIALDGFAAYALRPLPPLAQQHLDAFAAQEGYALLTLQVQREQADYLLVRGCPGCTTDTCVVGCRAALLRRALASALPGVTPRVLRHPLRQRRNHHALLAWPTRGATPLDRSLLIEAEEVAVHLAIHREGDGVRTIALIALGAVDEAQRRSVIQVVRERGWRAAPLPRVVLPAFTRLLYGLPLIRGTRGAFKPHLLTHTGAACTPPESAPADPVGAAMGDASGRVDVSQVTTAER